MRKRVLLSLASLVFVGATVSMAWSDQQLGTPPGQTITVSKTVDVRFVEAIALDVLQFFEESAGIDVLLSPELLRRPSTRITINARAANVANAFAQACKLAGLRFILLDGNTVMVAPN